MAKTTVVIPNWNGMAYLKNCMDSLEKQDDRDFEILVIDNASKDGSVAFLRENYPWARVEVMPENLGFAGGVNEGIRRTKTPYVLLLNNDVEVEPHFVKALTDAIDRDPKVFSVSSKMIKFRERHLLDDAGDRYTVIGWQAQRGTALPVTRKHYNRPAAVFSACAGAAIYRLSVLQEIGAFDPAHFAYLEDIDLGWRARIYGYKNMYEPSAVVYHVGSASSGAVTYSDFKVRISARNSQYIVYKNMPAFQRFLCAFPMWIGRKVKKRYFERLGFGEAYEEGLKEAEGDREKLKKVPYKAAHFWNYVKIQARMTSDTFIYAIEYAQRKIARIRAKRKNEEEEKTSA